MDKVVIASEKEKLYADRAYLVLNEVVTRLLTGWLPALAGGLAGWFLGWILPLALRPIAKALAKEANWFRIDYLEGSKLKAYQGQKDALRALESLYHGGELSPEEKKANESFDRSADIFFDFGD